MTTRIPTSGQKNWNWGMIIQKAKMAMKRAEEKKTISDCSLGKAVVPLILFHGQWIGPQGCTSPCPG